MTRRLLLLALAALVGCAASFAQNQNQLVNGTFDTDVSGWMPRAEHPGVAEWEPTLGQPPGAMSITDEYGTMLTEECYPAGAGDYYLHADAYMRTSGDPLFCYIEWALYETDDCSGSYSILRPEPLSSWVLEPNQWVHLEWNRVGASNNSGVRAARPVLGKSLGTAGSDDTCVFDNVYFEVIVDPVAPPPIPAVSPVGLTAIALLLGFAGLVVLRRRSANG